MRKYRHIFLQSLQLTINFLQGIRRTHHGVSLLVAVIADMARHVPTGGGYGDASVRRLYKIIRTQCVASLQFQLFQFQLFFCGGYSWRLSRTHHAASLHGGVVIGILIYLELNGCFYFVPTDGDIHNGHDLCFGIFKVGQAH